MQYGIAPKYHRMKGAEFPIRKLANFFPVKSLILRPSVINFSPFVCFKIYKRTSQKKLDGENMTGTPTSFLYSFPAIRGVQAGREYYVSMCPLKLIPKLFHFDDVELEPELRAQRILNKNRIPSIANYLVENKDNYTFSAITVSIDGECHFETVENSVSSTFLKMGTLSISMDANFIINDGQHRKAAIEEALKRAPELENETIAVVFFADRGLQRCQQMFADLNRYAVRPSASIGVLYDTRSTLGNVVKYVALKHSIFSNRIEMEKSSIALRSRKLFTLSALNYATRDLLADNDLSSFDLSKNLALRYWESVSSNIKEWKMLSVGRVTSGELREKFVHSHSVLLQALGRVGRQLLKDNSDEFEQKLQRLSTIDWRRSNIDDWEGRAMNGGRMAKNSMNVSLCTNKLKILLGLPLEAEELEIEKRFKR